MKSLDIEFAIKLQEVLLPKDSIKIKKKLEKMKI